MQLQRELINQKINPKSYPEANRVKKKNSKKSLRDVRDKARRFILYIFNQSSKKRDRLLKRQYKRDNDRAPSQW